MNKYFSFLAIIPISILFIKSPQLNMQGEKAKSDFIVSESSNEKQILNILSEQSIAWNEGDLHKYMQGYWQSDSLIFIGKNGITNGWEATLTNYMKSYPNKAAMGKLNFDILKISPIENLHYSVIGKWTLNREKDLLSGHFFLIWKLINGKWVIIADHSS